MSRSYDLGHILMKVRISHFEEDLKTLINIDEDMNGNNGLAYTRKEAIEEGFHSTLDYIVSKAKELGKTKEAIEYAINQAFGNDNYYDEYEYTIWKEDFSFTVAISYMYGS